MTLLEIDEGRLVNLDEIAAIEDTNLGASYTAAMRTKITLRCGSTVSSRRGYAEIRDAILRAHGIEGPE